jgi:ABC-type transport system involved in cytochrome bd biosynthesis fused ATPase/permease subunit
MKFVNIVNFFFSQIEKKNWIFVIFNYFLVLLITFCDIIFFSIFYLILNKKIESKFINLLLDNSNFFISKYSLSFDLDKLYITFLLFFLIFKNILTFFQTYFYGNFIHNITLNKSSQALETYFDLDFSTFNKKEISIYIKQILRDVESAFLGIFGLLISFFGEITYVVLLLVYLDYLVGLTINSEIIILFMTLSFIIYYLFTASEKLGKLRAFNEIKVFKTLSDILSIFRELKLNNQSKLFIDRFRNFLRNYYKSKIYSGLINIAPKLILEFFAILLFFILYKQSNLDINNFFIKFSVLALAMLRLIPSIARLSYYITNIFYNFHSIEFIKDDLNKNIKSDFKTLDYKSINSIKLKNISLSYYSSSSSQPFKILNNFNIFLKKNNIYGIYGPSGSGKTSLLNILIGFAKPQRGKIYYNKKLQILNQIANNYNISFLPQNPTILNENIIINSTLKFSNEVEEINKIKFYLRKFNLRKFLNYRFINNDNIQSIKNMSGGEKQRIAFVRSIINEPELLILDEPVSSLDKKNSEIIFKFLRKYKKNKIIIVTSHKEYEKKYFDKIINL